MRSGVTLLVFFLALGGCTSMRPGEYSDFDAWLVGQPDRDYELVELEGRSPLEVMGWSYVTWPLFLARDALKWVAAPFVYPTFLFGGGADRSGEDTR